MGTQEAEDEADLGALARQTLSGVEVNDLPPEPLALGIDLGRLATTSRPPAPPRKDDTDGRIDLRASSPGVVPAPAAAQGPAAVSASAAGGAAALAARLRARRGGANGTSRPRPLAVAAVAPSPPRSTPHADRELDELIASRSFSAAAVLESSLKRALVLAQGAPSWVWVLASGIAIGLVLGLALGGDDEEDQPTSSATSAASEAPTPSAAAPVLPAAVATLGSQRALQTSASAAKERPRARYDLGTRRAPSASNERDSQEPGGEARAPLPPPSEPRSIDSLLDQAIGGGATAQAKPAVTHSSAAGSSLPSTPARSDVARLLGEVLPRIRFCAGGRSGIAKAEITVRSTGRISGVKILGAPFARTTSARCMETAIRGVTFPAFSQKTFRVTYPYSL